MNIRQELEKRITTFATSYSTASTPLLQVAYEGKSFTKSATFVPFLEVIIVPGGTVNVTVDGTRTRERGTLMINVWVKDGEGAGKAETIADAVIAALPILPKGSWQVSIEQTGSKSRAMPEASGWRVLPVSMPYRYEGEVV